MAAQRARRPRALGTSAFSLLAAIVVALGLLTAPAATAGDRIPSATSEKDLTASVPGIVKTADLSRFQPGNIISDAVFFDRGSLSEAQIQRFLEGKVPTCRAGYTCLKDWYDTSRTTTADAMCGAYPGGTRERASTIIFKVAQACGINPQVLIVMLQKEQGLVLHTWPSDWRYRIAMGQGCPDTAACDTRYYGFFNQVYGAAWQLKRYANPAGTSRYFTWFAPGKTWNVRWHPNEACGSAPVYIQNQATANLYYYTPYQPNAAAIRAGYGEGDACSAYGNRNFYQYFVDWFGSTAAPTISSVDTGSYVLALDPGSVLWGFPFQAGGAWGDPITLATLAPGTKRVLSVGDLDGDGHRDIIAVDGSGAPSVHPGDGALGFGQARALGVDWSGARLIATAGDFNGDGAPDVFTMDAAGALLLWRNTGTGRLRAPIVAGTGWAQMTLLSGGTDMDADGAPDLIARNSNGNLYLYSGNGAGGWRRSTQIGTGWGGMTAILSPGDITGDGIPDVLARDADGGLRTYHGTGGGGIAGGALVSTGWQGMVDILGTGPVNTPARVLAAGAGDVDGDRARDVLAVPQNGQLLVYRGDGRGSWRGSLTADAGWTAGTRLVTLGDFTGDGLPDLAAIAADGYFQLRAGRGDGTFAAPKRIGNGWNTLTALIGGIDFDGDRNVDVIGRDATGNLILYRGNGAGGWLGAATIVGNGWGAMTALLYVGDFDGDRTGDVIARGADGSLWLYPTTGAGAWRGARQIGNGWQSLTALIGPGDFDSANGPDLLARNAAGQLLLYRGDGRGGWLGATVIGSGWNGMAQIG